MNDADFIAGQQLILGFYQALDETRFADAAKAFADHGEWHRKGEVLTGPAEVEAAYFGRSADLHTRHVITNFLLSDSAEGQDFSVYITLYAGKAAEGESPCVNGPAMVLTSHGSLIQHAGSWKISRKTTQRQFLIQPPQG
ncbi:nuclear transport factor 2 family protein [Pararhodobacter oceanensis]|uniref:nuclear transport factor 2 family protein n=1 Tax=Pararhodobacter oceanensis TaxID=2172121 RepID=UPI003A8DDFDA